MKLLKIIMKNGATQCAECGAFCQGFEDPRGKILCSDCYRKIRVYEKQDKYTNRIF